MQRLAPLLFVLLVLPAACRSNLEHAAQYYPVPDSVEWAFQVFADSVAPKILTALRPSGYHSGFSDSEPPKRSYTVQVAQVTLTEAAAHLYDASIAFELHKHRQEASGIAMPVFLAIHFGGNGRRWALLTSDGFLYSQNFEEGPRSDLPFETQDAIRSILHDRLEFGAWYFLKGSAARSDQANPSLDAQHPSDRIE